jgi:hypothetical protein
MLQGPGGQPCLGLLTADPAMLAASADGDVEGCFDLAQILVEGAAEVLQPRVVQRLQGKRQRAGRGAQGSGSGRRPGQA